MPDGRRVLITGIAGQLAGMLARGLQREGGVAELYGMDATEPRDGPEGMEFVRADIRDPMVSRIVDSTGVDTVVHMGTVSSPGEVGGRPQMKEQNVIGAMQLFAACQKAETVSTIVVKSSTAVYGSDHGLPALLREEDAPRGGPPSGFAKDATEVEEYARTLGRRRPDVDVTILRFANFLGGRLESTLSRFFTLPVVPTVMGYDPRLQLCHEEDAVAVLVRAVLEDRPGVFNVAGPGVCYLSQCIRLAGRLQAPVPRPLASVVAGLVRRTGRVEFSPEQLAMLQFGRVADITALREQFGYEPRYSTRETFEDFVARRPVGGVVDHRRLERWTRDLDEFLAGGPRADRGEATVRGRG